MREKEHGRPYDPERFAGQVRDAVADVVRRQAGAGIDVVTDGEQGKVSFFTYITERLGGFSSTDGEPLHMPSWQREVDAFPEYYADYFAKYSSTVTRLRVMACRWPVTYEGKAAVQADIDNLRAALDGVEVTEAFLPSTSPAGFGRNEYYPSEDDYHVAVAEALREEYRAIVDAGFVLQVDDPWLIEILAGGPGSSPEESRRAAERHVEVLNHALDGLPTEQLRPHACYGERLGHASPGFTLNVYQHVVPGMQAEAAVAFSRLLSGDA
jgi:5-methyltetrahydropteroyltriglutamate--homocysteine methyltransferase